MVRGKPRVRAVPIRSIKQKHDLHHKKSLLKKWGLTVEQYIEMHTTQRGRCGNPGCHIVLNLQSRSTHIDHDHKTGKIRSLLCSSCNTALGMMKESKTAISGLLDYIDKY